MHETVVNDELEFSLSNVKKEYIIDIEKFVSDRLLQKIGAFNEKGNLQSLKNGKECNPIEISEEGLEFIELISLKVDFATPKLELDDSTTLH